ncbi:MAG: response regulator transcription factor, partial [Alphaproteobacteria bacterium]|nr:response regulator transcription factor [Alphaproteobacteria bacterium]
MRILVAEDNETLAGGLAAVLRNGGYAVDVVHDGASADAALRATDFDLVVLDLNLPELDGLDVLRALRARRSGTAVLILTARGAMDQRVKGLDLGADDYMTKPFDVPELEARVRVLLRRRSGLHDARVGFGDIALDTVSRTVMARGAMLEVPQRELHVLETLLMKAGQVVAKQAIIESLAAF